MSVLSDTIEKCRIAMKAGIPLIYIKTDSYHMIRDIVFSGELVELLSREPLKGFCPWEERQKGDGAEPVNWKEKLDAVNTWECPHIVTLWADERSFSESNLIQYIKNYTNDSADPDRQSLAGLLKSSAVILYGSQIRISRRLLGYCEIIEAGFPEFEEIWNITRAMTEKLGQQIENSSMQQLCSLLQGFTVQEIRFTMSKVLTRERKSSCGRLLEDVCWNEKLKKSTFQLSPEVRKIIRNQKKQRLQDGSQVLKLISPGNQKIGGMRELTEYIDRIVRQRLLEDADQNKKMYGVYAPKGILLCGIPGCGKSLAAKLTAQRLDLTLLQMDMGNLMGGIQGQSEENMRRALNQVEAMSPCILWIDELEKGFGGVRADTASDGGTFKRMFATLLNWMQENTKPCFIFATANDIGGLPKELFRSGRFDELFGVYLPTAQECAEIFAKHVQEAIETTGRYRKNTAMEQFITDAAAKSGLYLEMMDQYFCDGEKVRIVIGSDIAKIVNAALAEFCQDIRDDEPISLREWRAALKESIGKNSVYGDSPENIESIAVGYCRMLRKGLRPTVKDPLFKTEDYHYENALKKGGGEEAFDAVLMANRPHNLSRYDGAVYDLLYAKINEVAFDIEKYERRKLVEG